MPGRLSFALLVALALGTGAPPAAALDGDRHPPRRGEPCMVGFSGWLVLDGVVRDFEAGRMLVRLDRGETGVGKLGRERFRFDSACHVYRASGRWLPRRPLALWIPLRAGVAFSTRTGAGPRPGDRVALTLSHARRADPAGIRRSRLRALDVLGRP